MKRDKIRFANFTRYRGSRQSPCLHETLARCSRNVKTSARTHTDRCTFFRYVFPPLALPKSGAVRRSIFLSACHTSSRSLFSVIIAPTCKNVKQDQALFLFCFSFLFSHPNAIIQMITDSSEPVAVASPIGNSVSGKIFEVR